MAARLEKFEKNKMTLESSAINQPSSIPFV